MEEVKPDFSKVRRGMGVQCRKDVVSDENRVGRGKLRIWEGFK